MTIGIPIGMAIVLAIRITGNFEAGNAAIWECHKDISIGIAGNFEAGKTAVWIAIGITTVMTGNFEAWNI